MPFTTGILVGIGETRAERLEALAAIRDSHARHGHVQEVIVQNFLPKPGTTMFRSPACDTDEYLWTIAAARIVLGGAMHLQVPPNLSDLGDLGTLIDAGIDDWGGVSPVTPDHVNPERPWPDLERLRDATEAAGKTLAPRLTVYPEYVHDGDEWLHPDVRFAVRCASDLEGLARDDSWAAGGEVAPPALLTPPPPGWTARARTPVGEVLDGVLAGEEVDVDEIVTLLGARGPDFLEVAAVADQLRIDAVGDAGHVRAEPQHQLHERLHLQVQVLCVLEGPALAQPARRARTSSTSRRSNGGCSRRSTAAPPRCACRAGSTPTSTATTTCRWRAR